jgi:hypothetical protein
VPEKRDSGKEPTAVPVPKINATCRCGLQLTGVTQRAFIPPPSPTLAGQTFVTGRTGRLAATDSPALSGQAPKPCGLGVETLRSPRRRPAGVVSFSNWLSDRSRAKCSDRAPSPAIRNIRSRTGIRSASVPDQRFIEKVAASAAGAKAGVAEGGAYRSIGDDFRRAPHDGISGGGARPPRPMNFQGISDPGHWAPGGCNKGHASATAGQHTVTNPVSGCDSKSLRPALPFALAGVGRVVRIGPSRSLSTSPVTKP